MTNKELNRDIRRLLRRVEAIDGTINQYDDKEDREIRAELLRLIRATNWMELTARSLRALIYLNRRYRVEAFHHFGPGLNQI